MQTSIKNYSPTPTVNQIREHAIEKRFELMANPIDKKHLEFLTNDIISLLNIDK